MSNGATFLSELKRLREKGGEISPEAAIQLSMTALIDLNESLAKLSDQVICQSSNTNDRQAGLELQIDALSSDMKRLKTDVQETNSKLAEIQSSLKESCFPNPMIKIGCLIKEHPKITMAVFGAFLITLNLWFIPEFRYAVMSMAGVPKEIIDILSTPTP